MSSSLPPADPRLDQLLGELPELYQPIYGHPELQGARDSDGLRVTALLAVVDALASVVDRPLRVLDLGSAQGYLAFRVAERNHHVTGIESIGANLAVAEYLRAEHATLDVTFVAGDVAAVAELVDLPSFDLVIGFSILHHLAHRDGHDATEALVGRMAAAIPHAVVEMAVAAEPVPWSVSLPRDPRHTLAAYPFCRELIASTTHLSDVARPVLFCSRTHALVNGALVPIVSWTDRSHDRSGDGQAAVMRYFHLDGAIVKTAGDLGPDADPDVVRQLREDLRRESHIIDALSRDGLDVPTVVEFADGVGSSLLARTTIPGDLLSSVLASLSHDERVTITSQTLHWLSQLESRHLHHSDLRSWNVVIDRAPLTTHVIDYGAVRSTPTDAVWPNDAHFSLLLFLVELWSGRPMRTGEDLPRALDVDSGAMPALAVQLVSSLLSMPAGDGVATRLAERWRELQTESIEQLWPTPPLSWGWLVAQAVRSAWTARTLAEFDEVRRDHTELHHHHVELWSRFHALRSTQEEAELALRAAQQSLIEAEAKAKGFGAVIDQQASEIHRRTTELHALWFEHQAVLDDRAAVLRRAEAAEAALAAVLRSPSWRLTAPLRRLRRST